MSSEGEARVSDVYGDRLDLGAEPLGGVVPGANGGLPEEDHGES